MNLDNAASIERRRDPRTQAYVPITLSHEEAGGQTPAHLLDLSTGGAAILTTAYDSPTLGQHIDLHFVYPHNEEDGDHQEIRRETGIVVNLGNPEHGVARIGVRFIQQRSTGADLMHPLDFLNDHRHQTSSENIDDRWNTARHFDPAQQTAAATN